MMLGRSWGLGSCNQYVPSVGWTRCSPCQWSSVARRAAACHGMGSEGHLDSHCGWKV